MKKTTIVFAALVAASMAVSCQKEDAMSSKSSGPMVINAVAEGIGTATKVEMAYKYDLLWQAGDQIYVKDASSNDTFTLTSGAGTTNGTFTQDGSATFSGDVEAFYPQTIVSGGSLVWPATQNKDQAVPMYSKKTISGTTENFSFSSLGSVLQIVFNSKTSGVVLKSIKIEDGSKTLSGAFTVDSNGQAVITATDGAGITLDLGTSGVALGDGANYFNISIPAGKYSDFTITFTAKDGKECVMHSSTMPEVRFNTIGRLTLTGVFNYPDILIGKFSVASGKQVQFSRGNLQATYDGSKYTWGFAANQYDYVGNAAGNTTIGSQSNGAAVDLFGWSTASTNYGINTSTSADYAGDFVDWGKNIGDGNTWRTLNTSEWRYLLGSSTERTGMYKYGVSVCGKANCLIIAPDDFTGTIADTYDASDWPAAQSAGLVCLTAAGYRFGSNVRYFGEYGYYWSSSTEGDNKAYNVSFYSDDVFPDVLDYRNSGNSVRLITECK